jgi:hypothetical protein
VLVGDGLPGPVVVGAGLDPGSAGAVVVGLGPDPPGTVVVVGEGDGDGPAPSVVVGDGEPADGGVVGVGATEVVGVGPAGAAVVVGTEGSEGCDVASETNVQPEGTMSAGSDPGGTRAMSTGPAALRIGVKTSIVYGLAAITMPGCSPNQT